MFPSRPRSWWLSSGGRLRHAIALSALLAALAGAAQAGGAPVRTHLERGVGRKLVLTIRNDRQAPLVYFRLTLRRYGYAIQAVQVAASNCTTFLQLTCQVNVAHTRTLRVSFSTSRRYPENGGATVVASYVGGDNQFLGPYRVAGP